MSESSRRRFIQVMPVAGLTLLAACGEKAPPAAAPAPAPAPSAPPAPPAPAPTAAAPGPMLDPADPQAQSLGYVADATKADSAKFRTYVAGQACGNCSLYGGRAGEAAGPCPIYAGKQVSAKGWCSAYNKKAG